MILWLVVCHCGHRASSQSYSIDWYKISGGGGTSTSGVYSASVTIGQADAGLALAGGKYSIIGGFWAVIAAVPTPGAPQLGITFTATNTVAVSWPLPADGWLLECTDRVGNVPASWQPVSPPYQTNSTEAWVVVPVASGSRFYRLQKP